MAVMVWSSISMSYVDGGDVLCVSLQAVVEGGVGRITFVSFMIE